jgi:hypothetical protein
MFLIHFVLRHKVLSFIAFFPIAFCAAVLVVFIYLFTLSEYDNAYGPENFRNGVADSTARFAHIQLTHADVDGANLPPVPNQIVNDTTVAGIDTNHNYIRDDVEFAMFELYPIQKNVDTKGVTEDTNLPIRAAALQYAQAQQLLLTEVRSKYDLEVVLYRFSEQSFCEYQVTHDIRSKFTEDLDAQYILNTNDRKKHADMIYEKYFTGSGSGPDPKCFIE